PQFSQSCEDAPMPRNGLMPCLLVCALSVPAAAKPVARDLDRVVDAFADGFDGVVLVADRGKIVYERAVGLAVREWSVKHTVASKFDIASMTKSFTAVLILQLAEQGKLRVDAKLADYLPDVAHAGEVTIHQLLTHTAGIADYVPRLAADFTYCKPHAPLEVAAIVAKEPLHFAPGTRFEYCNTCYVLLGAVIERVTGRTYADVVAERILKPAGMVDSGMDAIPRMLPQRAFGYIVGERGVDRAPLIDMSVAYSTGGLYSTAHDMLRYDRALAGDVLLGPLSPDKMFAVETAGASGPAYGYGWGIHRQRAGEIDTTSVW